MYSINLIKAYTLSQRGDYMFVPTLDSKIVGSVIAKFRKKKGVSQEVLKWTYSPKYHQIKYINL